MYVKKFIRDCRRYLIDFLITNLAIA